jgi:hypothetical protein
LPGGSYLNRLIPTVERGLCEVRRRRDREQLTRELRASKQRLQALSASILQIQEAERLHIALELHDEIGQALTASRSTWRCYAVGPRPRHGCGNEKQGCRLYRAIEQGRNWCWICGHLRTTTPLSIAGDELEYDLDSYLADIGAGHTHRKAPLFEAAT